MSNEMQLDLFEGKFAAEQRLEVQRIMWKRW
jgi:hypothetical protein